MKKNLRLMKVCAVTGMALTSILADNAYAKAAGYTYTPTASFRSILQEKEISGTVRDSKGAPLPGVSVQVKGTTKGAQTNANGQYHLNAKAGDVLVFSSIGFGSHEAIVGSSATLDVRLDDNVKGLNELVVTALGVKKAAKSLTYSTQRLGNEELTTAKDANVMNSISGKAAGITVSRSSSGVGGSVKVTLRGAKSAQSTNQPLYVIDGIPMTNYSTQQPNSTWGGDGTTTFTPGRDGGDGISNMNPDDIESVSVLKGASASALYGSQAANGVILITTKKGKAGNAKVEFSSGFTLDKVAYKPALQNSYGATKDGSTQSWGPEISNAHDNVSDFFRNGNTWINSINFTAGNEKAQTYFSYANTNAKGVIPGNDLNRHNFSFRETAKFLNDRLTLDGNVNIISQKLDNGPVNGLYFNPLTGLYLFPRGRDMAPFKNSYMKFDETRQINLQNWPFNEDVQQNPYWIVNKNTSQAVRNRTLFNASAKYDFNDWLYLQARGNMDRTNDTYDGQFYAGTNGVLSGANGRYIMSNLTTTQFYGDLILNLNRNIGNFKLNALLGTSINDTRTKGMNADSYLGDLYVANFFTLQNMTTGSLIQTVPENHSQLQAAFGNVNLSYKDLVFLDLSGRNDWSSNLAFTGNGSYFYPSAGLSFMLHQLFNMPEPVSYAKLRGSYAVVGNTVPWYVTNPLNRLGQVGGTFLFNNQAPFKELKPEKTKSLEIGTEWRFLNNRLNFDFTYYKTNTTNQYFQIAVPPGTGYSFRFINAGNIQNSGIEVVLGYNVIQSGKFTWNTTLNYSKNKNEVIELADNIDQFILTPAGSNTFASIMAKGGSYGDIYGKTLKRDESGRVIIGSDGTPLVTSDLVFVGNSNPKWQGGWNNRFTYNDFTLSFLIDGKFGGKVMSMTEAVLDKYGVSERTGAARKAGGVTIDGINESTKQPVTKVDAEKWYGTIGGRDGVSGEYMYDATVVRLRELSLGYGVPSRALGHGFVKSLRFSLVGRNLWYISKKAPYDPEIALSTGNGLSGVDMFGMPATRSFGFNLNVGF
ncbi:SusC/RagA family TonB-linked outer membrane protein [Chitinophaga varians]|uniref:SusC/RagA family TonB-linked outer membrane protein n=1 Tax=Chitinophaga varians TaxID=2202339 RepID=A0A847S3E0_9BACT|nr:SusC/RagA family TonB-linked outer membrane protein [Chitinophaga varians]NLR66041.1 SusC/RagA family TonB-linked outer membrane protein [Chitinophaga varians]